MAKIYFAQISDSSTLQSHKCDQDASYILEMFSFCHMLQYKTFAFSLILYSI